MSPIYSEDAPGDRDEDGEFFDTARLHELADGDGGGEGEGDDDFHDPAQEQRVRWGDTTVHEVPPSTWRHDVLVESADQRAERKMRERRLRETRFQEVQIMKRISNGDADAKPLRINMSETLNLSPAQRVARDRRNAWASLEERIRRPLLDAQLPRTYGGATRTARTPPEPTFCHQFGVGLGCLTLTMALSLAAAVRF